jgi:hypothetical protein
MLDRIDRLVRLYNAFVVIDRDISASAQDASTSGLDGVEINPSPKERDAVAPCLTLWTWRVAVPKVAASLFG